MSSAAAPPPPAVREQIDALARRHAEAWAGGARPRAEEVLAAVETAYRPALLRALLAAEVGARRRRGESPVVEDYGGRFPEASDWLHEQLPSLTVPGSTPTLGAVTEPSGPPGEPLPVLAGYTFPGRVLGAGGMGVVWRARDERLHREVAVKVLRAALVGRPQYEERFRGEAQLTSQLQHPGLPPVHEAGTLADGRPYFCMKVVKGRTLAELLQGRAGPGDDRPHLLQVFEQVCQAVGYAHSKGVIHRDLKPGNVMVGAFGEVQVMDWGLGKVLGGGEPAALAEPEVSVVQTDRDEGSDLRTGVLGTFAYMPPEQARGRAERMDRRSDVFSLGAILCEILTGQPPFVGSAEEVRSLAEDGDAAGARQRLRACGADGEVVALAEACLSKEREDRPADAGVVAAAVAAYEARVRERLQRAEVERAAAEAREEEARATSAAEVRRVEAEAREEEARATAAAERRARWRAWWLAGALVLGLAGTTYFLLQSRHQTTKAEVARVEAEKAKEDLEWLRYVHKIGLAQREWDASNPKRAWDHLEATTASFRGWEFNYLQHLFTRNHRTLQGHDTWSSVRGVAFSPDGTCLATGSSDGTVKVWDVATGQVLHDLACSLEVMGVAFSPDGKLLAAGCSSFENEEPSGRLKGEVRLWDTRGYMVHRTLEFSGRDVWCVAFSRDGKLLAAATGRSHEPRKPGKITVMEAATLRELVTIQAHKGATLSLSFGPAGHLLSVGQDGAVKIWDTGTGKHVRDLLPGVESTATGPSPIQPDWGGNHVVRNVTCSPDGEHVAAACWDQTVKIWDVGTGRGTYILKGHAHCVHNVAYCQDGKRLASASWDGTVRVWDVESGHEIRCFKGHKDWVLGLAFSRDGQRLASGSKDGTVKLWDAATGQDPPNLHGHASEVLCVSFSPDGRLASGGADNTVRIWDTTTRQLLLDLKGHTDSVLGVAFSADGAQVASASADNTVRVRDAKDGRLLHTLSGHTDSVNAVAYRPGSKQLASASSDGTIRIWDPVTSGEPLVLRGQGGVVTEVCFDPTGSRLVSAERDKRVTVWDVATGERVWTLATQENPFALAFSPHGRHVAVAGRGRMMRILDSATGREVRRLEHGGDRDKVNALRFHPISRYLVTVDHDRTAKLWDIERGQVVLTLHGHTGPVTGVAFSPDGTRLATGSWDRTIRIWEAPRVVPAKRSEE